MKIHWFGVTVKCDYDFALQLWNYFFSFELGLLSNSSRAGRGFQHIDTALQEAKLYWSPFPQQAVSFDYCHFEFPGSACDVVLPERFSQFFEYLSENQMEFKITRLDLAFDHCPFTPKQFFERAFYEDCSTHAKRETFTFTSSPEYVREDGSLGSDTCYIGSRSSSRFLRVYDERGFTRLEIVLKDDRAHAVAVDLFSHSYSEWVRIGKAHVLDFIRFENWSVWDGFIEDTSRADLVISAGRKVSLSKIRNWLAHQVSPALSVLFDVLGEEETWAMLRQMVVDARNLRDRSRYSAILAMRDPFEGLAVTLNPPEDFPHWDLLDYHHVDMEVLIENS